MNDLNSVITEEIKKNSISPGEMLRIAREAQGLNIEMLAALLKVPVKKIEALELNRYDLLSDVFFVRALASSICRVLKIDSSSILLLLPSSEIPHIKTDEAGLNAVFSEVSTGIFSFVISKSNKFVLFFIAFLFVIIASLFFWPKVNFQKISNLFIFNSDYSTSNKNLVSSISSAVNSKPIESLRLPSNDSSTNVINPTSPESSELQTASTPQSVVTDSATVSSLKSEQLTNDLENTLELKANGVTWVEVTDADGIILLSKNLLTDESAQLAGHLPLRVVLGRADMVKVNIRGQVFNLTNFTKNNIARFEVN